MTLRTGGSRENPGVYLDWKEKNSLATSPYYKITFGNPPLIVKNSSLRFDICNNKNDIDTFDFSILIETETGTLITNIREYFELPTHLYVYLENEPITYQADDHNPERILQTVEIPNLFHNTPTFLKSIMLLLIRQKKKELFIDKIRIKSPEDS